MAIKRKREINKKPVKPRTKARFFVFIFLLLIIGSFYFLSLPIWQIRNIEVNGASLITAEDIKEISGIPLSENLFFFDAGRVRRNLKKITAIESFRLYRLPPGTVVINLKERKPVATVIFPKRSVVIDQKGYILNLDPDLPLNIPNLVDLPVISGIAEKGVVEKEKIDEQTMRVISDIISTVSGFLDAKKAQINLGQFKDINILLDDFLRIRLGEAHDLPEKMRVFQALLPKLEAKRGEIEYIDLRCMDSPVVKFRAGA